MTFVVVVGAQWGDEGKGKVVVKHGVAKDQRGMSKAAQRKHEKAEPRKKKIAETKKYGAS